jgi:hypothetical protein
MFRFRKNNPQEGKINQVRVMFLVHFIDVFSLKIILEELKTVVVLKV